MAQQQPQPLIKTIVIDNFEGSMTDYYFGDMNSGRSWVQVAAGQNPFLKPRQLTWSDAPVQIDSAGSVITDLIMCGKERVESGVVYVYAVGHTGRVYKIQVNNPATSNPDYDNPVLLTTLTTNSPTFTRGGFIEFFDSPEKMYIGHDMGVTYLNFDGSSETFVGSMGSWTQTVPRPLKQFQGNLVVGNGSNIAQVSGGSTVITYTKLSPGFPTNTQVRDLELTPDGNYIQAVVSRLALQDVTSGTQQTMTTANVESYLFSWNGSDAAATSLNTYPSFSLCANTIFQDKQYVFGADQFGFAIYDPFEIVWHMPECQYVSPNAIRGIGNMLHLLGPIYYGGFLQTVSEMWGPYDFEVGNPLGYWSPFFQLATSPETDVSGIPFMISVSNTGLGASWNGYTNNQFGTSKIYYSTLETSGMTTKYRFYKWNINTSLQTPVSTNTMFGLDTGGFYQTQVQMFSKKITPVEIRVYGDPWIAGNAFQIDLCGSSSVPTTFITGGSKLFTAGTNLTVGDDMAQYNPQIKPTYALGVAITNMGATNHTISKIEVDYVEAGK